MTLLKLGNISSKVISSKFLLDLLNDGSIQRVKQFHLYIHLYRDALLIRNWFQALQPLYYDTGYSLYDFKQISPGWFKSGEAIFLTSWISVADTQGVPAALNRQSGDEEALSILKTMTSPHIKCYRLEKFWELDPKMTPDRTKNSKNGKRTLWPLCVSNISPPCNVFSARLGSSHQIEDRLADIGCQVVILDPYTQHTTNKENIKISNELIVTEDEKNKENSVYTDSKTITLKEALIKYGLSEDPIDIMLLDLEGVAWGILKDLASQKVLNRVQQLIISTHVWFGEDYYNLLDRYMSLSQIQAFGLQVFAANEVGNTNDLLTLGSDLPTDGKLMKSCCYIVGWKKTEI